MSNSTTRKRWKLVALWGLAVVLAVTGIGATVCITARAAVEEEAREFANRTPGLVGEPNITFRRARFSSESWIILKFYVDWKSAKGVLGYDAISMEWRLREWDVFR